MNAKMLRNAGKNVRVYRLQHHLSVRAFGELIGRSGSWVSAFELGKCDEPPLRVMQSITRVLRVDLKTLVLEPPQIITMLTKKERLKGVENLISIWRKKKMGQIRFSRSVGMSDGFFGEVKRGTRVPNVKSWLTIADHLHVKLEKLVGRK